jgi:diguanylate cyclase
LEDLKQLGNLRTRFSYELTQLFLLGGCTCVAVMTMATYRATRGEWGIFWVDSGIVAAILAVLTLAWRFNKTKLASHLLVAIHVLGSHTILWLFGRYGVYWITLVVATNYFLIEPRRALLANLFLLSMTLVISLSAEPLVFSDDADRLSYAITSLMIGYFGYAIAQRTQIHQARLEQLVSRDPLTGVGNRRALEAAIARTIAAQQRREIPFALLMFDLDHFKSVNDRFGHEFGDRVLLRFVEIIHGAARRTDEFFRMGGEEFVLLMERRAGEDLIKASERLRIAIETQLSFAETTVTTSMGVASLNPVDTPASWLQRADQALYEAKARGRNRVVLAE